MNGLFDTRSMMVNRERLSKELGAKERNIKMNKGCIWAANMAPILHRMSGVCMDRAELRRKLMDSKDEYFKYCRGLCPPRNGVCDNGDACCVRQVLCGTETDEYKTDPAMPMRTTPWDHKYILFAGHSSEGLGYEGYLKARYNSGLPETRFCRPPTVNSEYAWQLWENVNCRERKTFPRKAEIRKFYRARGAFYPPDFAPFVFPIVK